MLSTLIFGVLLVLSEGAGSDKVWLVRLKSRPALSRQFPDFQLKDEYEITLRAGGTM